MADGKKMLAGAVLCAALGAVLALSVWRAFERNDAVDVVVTAVGGGRLARNAYEVESMPIWFEDELFSVAGATELYANEDESVFGLTMGGPAEEAFSSICADMEERGWLQVESGMAYCATFLREEGEPTWVLVGCTPVGDAVSIVVGTDGGA